MAASVEFNGQKITDKLDLLVQVELPWIASLTLSGKRKGDTSLINQVEKDLLVHQKNFKLKNALVLCNQKNGRLSG